jgi:phenylalanyl-tRNA synthetase beta chain
MICLGPKKVLGIFGELHPRVLDAMDVKGPAMAFTLFPAEIPTRQGHLRQPGRRDDAGVPGRRPRFRLRGGCRRRGGALVNAAQGADKSLIAGVRVFDEFIGGSLGEGKKSIALTVHLQPTDRTLTEDEIDAVAAKVVEKVTKATGGVLRG